MASEQTNHTDSISNPFNEHSNSAFNQRKAANSAAHLVPRLKPHHRILDVGCGPGSITLDLAQLVPQGRVVGIDINADGLATARAAAKEQNMTNIEFREGDATDLSTFEDESFDIVHAHQVLMYLRDPAAVLREMRRIVTKGGIVSTRDCAAVHRYPSSPQLQRQEDLWADWMKSKGGDLYFGRISQHAAHEAGFPWENIYMSSWGWEWSNGKEKEKMAELGKFGMLRKIFDEGTVTQEEVREAEAAWDAWLETQGSRFMVLDGAILCLK